MNISLVIPVILSVTNEPFVLARILYFLICSKSIVLLMQFENNNTELMSSRASVLNV
jgi:hypothetical protein